MRIHAALTTVSSVNASASTVGKTACVVWSPAAGLSGAAPAAYAADMAPPGMNAAAMSTFLPLRPVVADRDLHRR
jgi:hypothetical protein